MTPTEPPTDDVLLKAHDELRRALAETSHGDEGVYVSVFALRAVLDSQEELIEDATGTIYRRVNRGEWTPKEASDGR